MIRPQFFLAALFVFASAASGSFSYGQNGPSNTSNSEEEADEARKPAAVKTVAKGTFGSTKNVHQCGSLLLAGQFAEEDIEKFTDASVKRVITLRTDGEVKWDEMKAIEAAKMEFVVVPFRSPDSLTDEVFDKIRKLLRDQKKKTLFHCGSANRVGAVWLPYRVLDEGVAIEQAIKEAKEIGMRTEAYQVRALDYIKRKQKKK